MWDSSSSWNVAQYLMKKSLLLEGYPFESQVREQTGTFFVRLTPCKYTPAWGGVVYRCRFVTIDEHGGTVWRLGNRREYFPATL